MKSWILLSKIFLKFIALREIIQFTTPRLIKLIKKKTNAKMRLNRDGSKANKNVFSKLRKQATREIKLCFANYVNDCEDKLKSNTKCFFSLTKSLRTTNSLVSKMKYGDKASNARVSDLFNRIRRQMILMCWI